MDIILNGNKKGFLNLSGTAYDTISPSLFLLFWAGVFPDSTIKKYMEKYKVTASLDNNRSFRIVSEREIR